MKNSLQEVRVSHSSASIINQHSRRCILKQVPRTTQIPTFTKQLGNSAVKSSNLPYQREQLLQPCRKGFSLLQAKFQQEPTPTGGARALLESHFVYTHKVKSTVDDPHRCLSTLGVTPNPAVLKVRSLDQQQQHQKLRDTNPGPRPQGCSETTLTLLPPSMTGVLPNV